MPGAFLLLPCVTQTVCLLYRRLAVGGLEREKARVFEDRRAGSFQQPFIGIRRNGLVCFVHLVRIARPGGSASLAFLPPA
jgi:hypothetical protein